MTYLKLFIDTIILNILRYFPGGIIESYTIFEPMHKPVKDYPDCFGFTMDLPVYLTLWLSVVLIFHIAPRSLNSKMIFISLLLCGICFLFYASLTAVYMNHHAQEIRIFYLYSILGVLILFVFLGIINGFLYPVFFKHENL